MLTEQQLRERKNYIGGSDVAAILGYSKWKTPIDVFLEKTTDYERSPDVRRDFNLKVGKALEDIIIDDYVTKNNILMNRNVELTHESINYLIGHPDGLSGYGEPIYLLEVKTVYAENDEWGEEGTDQIPVDYLYQAAFYCWLKKIEFCIIIVYFKDFGKIKHYKYTRNESIEKEMEEKLPEFWENYVLKNEMPPAVRATDISHAYKRIETIKLDVDKHAILTAMQQHKDLTAKIKELKDHKDELREQIVLSLGGYGQIVNWENEKIGTFTNQLSKRVDMERLKKEYPDVYAACLKESYSQVLRIK